MKKNPFLIVSSVVSLLLVGCGGETKGKCIDGGDHAYVHHEAVTYEEKNGTAEYYSCSKCEHLFDVSYKEVDKVPVAPPNRKIILPYKMEGERQETIDNTVIGYLSCRNEEETAGYLYTNRGRTECSTKSVMISWRNSGSSGSYKVQLSKDSSFSKIDLERATTSTSISLSNLEPSTYYYKVVDTKGNESLVDYFTMNPLRTIKSTNGGVVNMRDLGGWETTTGDKIRYGKLYRSALPSTADVPLFNELGIKTEIDLRIKGGSADQIGDFNGISPNINYVIALGEGERYWPQYDMILEDQYKSYSKGYFDKIFTLMSDEANYPINFHCKSGADRTGTLAYLINGLCGVSYENLTKDFELTSFYKSPRWRSDIQGDGATYWFTDTGMMATGDNVHWGKFHKEIMEKYGDSSKLVSKAILNYLTSYCEVDEMKIKKSLSILLEGEAYLDLFAK